MKRLSARARKAQNKILNCDARCMPVQTIVRTGNGFAWLSVDDNGLPVIEWR